MKPHTAQALRALDRAFYRECADAFAETRTRPWSGFAQILEYCPHPLSVLDVGCGNGRFAVAMASQQPTLHVSHYLGMDMSPELIALARDQSAAWPFPARFVQHDVLQFEHAPWGGQTFGLVAAFGLLHHIPGRRSRLDLVEYLGRQLEPDGLLALSLFRYDRSHRLLGRRLEPEACRALLPASAVQDLEPGDFLLPFGHTERVRYCHLFDEDETSALAQTKGLQLITRLTPERGSDRLNDYLLLRRQ